jgi:Predicted small integral membrane protein (DUF2165)
VWLARRGRAHADHALRQDRDEPGAPSLCLLVAFDNITDYGTNYLFVQHVMSMDTTFPGNALMYRSITNPVLWRIGDLERAGGRLPLLRRRFGRADLRQPA